MEKNQVKNSRSSRNDATPRKALVRGDYRLELLGYESSTELQWLKQLGVQSEYVSHKLRAFVPLENAIAVLKTIQESYQRSDRFS